MAGVAALAIARFNSRRVRVISWWLRMTLMRRDILTILSSTRVLASSNLKIICVTRGRAAIFQLIAERPCSRLAQHAACPALCAEHLLGALGAERLAWDGASVG